MADYQFIGPGKFWLLVDSALWVDEVKDQKAAGTKNWTQKMTVENKSVGEAFIVAEFDGENEFSSDVVKTFDVYQDGDDPWNEDLWVQNSPSAIHYAAEAVDDIKQGAAMVPKAIAGATSLAWAGAALAGGLWLLTRRR